MDSNSIRRVKNQEYQPRPYHKVTPEVFMYKLRKSNSWREKFFKME